MRIRTIKPEFPQSESVGRLSRDARLLFILLWPICDDSGRTRAASRMLASLLFPYDEDAPKLIEHWLGELERESMVRRYSVNGDTYLEICNWQKHQKIDKPSASKLPAFAESSRILAESSPNPRERSSEDRDQGSGTKDQGKEEIAPEALPFSSPEFSEAWSQWQKHRTEIRKPLKPTMRAAQLAELAAMGEQRAIAALRHTIAKGWQGIREPEAQQGQGTLVGFAPRASLGALQIELKAVREEIADILHPGGCSGTVEPKGDKRARYDSLVERRNRIQSQIEKAA